MTKTGMAKVDERQVGGPFTRQMIIGKGQNMSGVLRSERLLHGRVPVLDTQILALRKNILQQA